MWTLAIAVGGLAVVAVIALVVRQRSAEPVATGPAEPDPTIGQPVAGAKVFFLGHSLVGPHLPQLVESFAVARGKACEVHGQLGWGTMLRQHWGWDGAMDDAAPPGFQRDNRPPFFLGEAKAQLDTGSYQVLVLTESNGHVRIGVRETVEHATRFVRRARTKNPTLRAYVYTGWLDRKEFDSPAAWRERTRADRAWWERVADGINAAIPGPDVGVIPGGAILAAVSEAVEQGRVPGVARDEELFADSVHLGQLGLYVIALAQYAVIFRDDPTGLPDRTRSESGESAPVPSAVAASLQALVWEHLRSWPRAAIGH
ncbi:MAG: hypothetical protein WBO45_03560 [Planctomycetota bacterium]